MYKQPYCTAAEWRAIQEGPKRPEVKLPGYMRVLEGRTPTCAVYENFAVLTAYILGPVDSHDAHVIRERLAGVLGVKPAHVDGPHVCPLTSGDVVFNDITYYVEPRPTPARKGGKGNEEAE